MPLILTFRSRCERNVVELDYRRLPKWLPSLARQKDQGKLAASRGDAPPGRAAVGAHCTMPEAASRKALTAVKAGRPPVLLPHFHLPYPGSGPFSGG
jgi:hypothetical protein